ncbi:MAG: hypothetical protein IKQ97_05695, partial [Eubacterium sp.]|nr:hypothetical protein [Eubacterium sp.]
SLIEKVLATVAEGAESMDSLMIEDALEELSEYSIPEEYRDKIDRIRELVDMFDFDGIIEIL